MPPRFENRPTLGSLRRKITLHNHGALDKLCAGLVQVGDARASPAELLKMMKQAGAHAKKSGLRAEDGHNIADLLYQMADANAQSGSTPVMLTSPKKFNDTVIGVLTHLAERTDAARMVAEIKHRLGQPNHDAKRESEILIKTAEYAEGIGIPRTDALNLIQAMLEVARREQDLHRERLKADEIEPRP